VRIVFRSRGDFNPNWYYWDEAPDQALISRSPKSFTANPVKTMVSTPL
jgi:hypothetical protein